MANLTGSLAIGYGNLVTGHTVTATSSASGYAASKLSTPRLGEKWRSTAGSLLNQDIDVDLGSDQDYQLIALLGTNIEDAGTIRPYGDSNSGFPSPDYDPGSASAFDVTVPPIYSGREGWPVFGRHVVHLAASTRNDRYIRARLSNSGNADNYLQASVYWVSKILQLSFSSTWEPDPWRMSGGEGSELPIRTDNFLFKGLTLQDKINLESLYYINRRTGRMVLIPRPSEPKTWQSEVKYCVFSGSPRLSRMLTDEDRWVAQVGFEEVLD